MEPKLSAVPPAPTPPPFRRIAMAWVLYPFHPAAATTWVMRQTGDSQTMNPCPAARYRHYMTEGRAPARYQELEGAYDESPDTPVCEPAKGADRKRPRIFRVQLGQHSAESRGASAAATAPVAATGPSSATAKANARTQRAAKEGGTAARNVTPPLTGS